MVFNRFADILRDKQKMLFLGGHKPACVFVSDDKHCQSECELPLKQKRFFAFQIYQAWHFVPNRKMSKATDVNEPQVFLSHLNDVRKLNWTCVLFSDNKPINRSSTR